MYFRNNQDLLFFVGVNLKLPTCINYSSHSFQIPQNDSCFIEMSIYTFSKHNVTYISATILQTMRRDGNVMIAVDTAGRMLELAQLLVRTCVLTMIMISFLCTHSTQYSSTVLYMYLTILEHLRTKNQAWKIICYIFTHQTMKHNKHM